MKQNGKLRRWLGLNLFSLICAGSVGVTEAQTTNFIVAQFDTDTAGTFIDQRWGTAVPRVTWDNTQNAATTLVSNNSNSGSAKWVVPWTTVQDQIMVTHALGATLNLNQFASVSFDIHFDSSSATDGAGHFGAVEIDWVPAADGWPSTPNAPQAFVDFASGNTNWIHATMPINAASISKLSAVIGMGFKIQQTRTGANLTGTTTFWIDNIILTGLVTTPIVGPPQIVQLNSAQYWQRLEFQITNVPAASNPFDPDVIRLDATFTLPSGSTIAVPAFWYQGYTRSLSGGNEYDAATSPPQWRLRFTPPQTGAYSVSLTIQTNHQPYGGPVVTNFVVPVTSPPARYGYVSVAPNHRYFQTGDGRGLPLIGENVAWPTGRGTYDYDAWFASMQTAHENFARIWMWPTSFGIEDAQPTLNNYSLAPAWQLDYVLQLAEQKGIYVQLTLDYHGMFAVTPDTFGGNNYWPVNPYNITNGGPCLNQNAFFTNSTAMTIYQKRLRYLVGRYGYSQNLLDWELFNEIDNDYAFLNSAAVAAWHGVMGAWLHTNDPFGHLVTTSLTYASNHPELWSLPQLNFVSEHLYNAASPATRLKTDVQTFIQTYGKPVMVGEYGTTYLGWDTAGDPYLRGFRQGIWGGALSGAVGTAMSWWWQNIDSRNDYSVYSALGTVLNRTGWGSGSWTNITFQNSQSLNAIGQRGPRESLLYLVASDATFPTNATTASLPMQQGRTVTLTQWPIGSYYAEWYDPATGSPAGYSLSITTNNILILPVPDFTVDLAGIVYPPPTFTTTPEDESGTFKFQFNSETGGQYRIEKSTDLSSWTPFLAITNTTGMLLLDDPSAATNSRSFFRAEHNR